MQDVSFIIKQGNLVNKTQNFSATCELAIQAKRKKIKKCKYILPVYNRSIEVQK